MSRNRYSRLAPLSIDQRAQLARIALDVFSPLRYREVCELVGKTADAVIRPLTAGDYVKFLDRTGALPEADRYMFPIRRLLDSLVSAGILEDAGRGNELLLGHHYYFLRELTTREADGLLLLSSALGPEFIYSQYSSATVHLTGKTADGEIRAGTGVVIAPNLILTCAHVLTDMNLDANQEIRGRTVRVLRQVHHRSVDVGLVEASDTLTVLPGMTFSEPVIGQEVYVLGYPRIHYTADAALLLHRGEVTNQSVTTLDGHRVFLFSAIARPGNSGGPIVSRSGHVIGLVTKDLSTGNPSAAPFYAGVPTSELMAALAELAPAATLPIEDYM